MAISSIKNSMTSRFKVGHLVEADYSQLEIRVLAIATRDPVLIDDLNAGIDPHKMFAAQIYGIPQDQVTPDQRKLAKGFSFQLQYGASAGGISKHWNVPKKLVQTFIDAYYTRYPLVKHWQDQNIAFTKDHAVNKGIRVKSKDDPTTDIPVLSSTLPGIWYGSAAPYIGGFFMNQVQSNYGEPDFAPTQIKNYPIQGGAADIILLVLGALHSNWRTIFKQYEHIHMVNTVHDSFLLDLDTIVLKDIRGEIESFKEALERLPAMLMRDMFGLDSPVAFPVDISIGRNWGDMKSIIIWNEDYME